MAATAIDYAPKTKIRLGGFLGKKYGKHHHFLLERGDAKEAAKALDTNFPGFARDLADAEGRGLRFALFKNGKNIGDGELGLGGARELWFVPVITGSKRGGLLQTVLGVALIGAASFASGGLAAGGVLQMLSPQASGLSHSGSPENLASYAFGSAKNITASGLPVPICIGHRRWGGAITSASIEAQDKA